MFALTTSLAVSVNSRSITQSDKKSKHIEMYYTYMLIIPTTLVCLLFSTAIPTLLFRVLILCTQLLLTVL